MKRIFTLLVANAVSTLHFFLLAYITSPYLGQFLSDESIGLVFSASAAIMIVGFLGAPMVLARFSMRNSAIVLALVDLVSLLLLAAGPAPIVAIALIALQGAIAPLISYALDLFLENATDDGETGQVRGLFLTAANVVLIASPLIVGIILDAGDAYPYIFLASAAALAIFVALLVTRRHSFVDGEIAQAGSLFAVLRCLIHEKEVRSILAANLLLQSFYIWAGIYIPLYLHSTLGFSWELLGPVFALMLLPFLLIELPMGFIEDRIKGARLIMAAGFVIMGSSLMALSFITAETALILIAFILVLTRIGAALIEITAETSFFRTVDGQDIESVGLFRMTRPLGILVGPLIGSFFLLSMPLQSIFIPLGIICLFGIPFAFRIKNGPSSEVRTRICSVR